MNINEIGDIMNSYSSYIPPLAQTGLSSLAFSNKMRKRHILFAPIAALCLTG